eukprot:UN31841
MHKNFKEQLIENLGNPLANGNNAKECEKIMKDLLNKTKKQMLENAIFRDVIEDVAREVEKEQMTILRNVKSVLFSEKKIPVSHVVQPVVQIKRKVEQKSPKKDTTEGPVELFFGAHKG